jgi:4-hydroxybenzoate polyprenyltransferase
VTSRAAVCEPEASGKRTRPDAKLEHFITTLTFWLKTSRPGLWLTTTWFYVLPLGQHRVFGSWIFWIGLVFFTFPFCFLVYGWNDIGDRETDRINPRKDTYLFGARGSEDQIAGLPRIIALVLTPFTVLFVSLIGIKAVGWFLALLAAHALYNWPKHGLKSRPPFDMINQAGYLLVFVLSSWLNDVPQLPVATFAFGALFAMHSHLFGEILDIEPDRLSGRRTTAVAIGNRASKLVLAVFLVFESVIVGGILGSLWIGAFLGICALWFVLDARFITRDRQYSPGLVPPFAIALNLVALVSMPLVWSSGTLIHTL